jgi:hypothetical protein
MSQVGATLPTIGAVIYFRFPPATTIEPDIGD